ncbi:hypothetical protein PVAG01_02512 [Phlyctema vagabunda]|uniref:Hydroxyacyl-thioester dehydratase type 2, mitochondrial n=1 Tax=Phlyctema vagabunda TaxID=108571 RepID=A0ABR4PS45_9HELO
MYSLAGSRNITRHVFVKISYQSILFRASSTQISQEQKLQQELVSRPVNTLVDYSVATPSRSLSLSLSDFLPASCIGSSQDQGDEIPIGHHLVYFPPQVPESQLLTDGTDPLHSPGGPYVRRMWAGGSVEFIGEPNLRFLAGKMTCAEAIDEVQVKGDKIFVGIRRSITTDESPEEPVLVENRNLVFMKEKSPEDARRDVERAGKIVRALHEPDYSVSLTPSQALLFRFSALTFNAHRIHLDPQYAREVEGHRGLLVHGPLTLVLMLSVLNSQLGVDQKIKRFRYRNLAPLYAEEAMRVCVKQSRTGREGFDVWIEGKDGGYAVKGSASVGSTK